jgi:class 3 adenylate cyclase/predicted ATPase
MDVADWLRALGLERYEAAFRENDVDAELLPNLTADDLKDLGITSVGHRRQLLKAIAALRAEGTQTSDVVQFSPRMPTNPIWGRSSSETTAERRQLSVMFCDLVGSTALSSQLDPEDLGGIIRSYQACVATTVQHCGGFIARYVGDGVLAYFGWPEARETDAERAVRAGLAVSAAVNGMSVGGEPLRVHLGIATGLVVVGESIGSGDSRQQTAIGETPNLAARLQSLAGPDQLVIDAATRRLIGDLFECQDLGTFELKGLPKAVSAWRVLGEGSLESRFEALHGSPMMPLIGREEELELLLRRWKQSAAGEGRIVLLAGEPGIGKSRLLVELEKRLAAERHATLRYFCSPLHQGSALHPVIARWERDAGFTRGDTAEQRLRKLESILALDDLSPTDVALLADMLSVPTNERYAQPELSAQRRKEMTFALLHRRLANHAQRQPVLMLFEDAHWADHSSLEVFDTLASQITELPILLVVSFRPEFVSSWIGRAGVSQITLTRLDRRQSAALAAQVTTAQVLTQTILDHIIDQTDGIPLFIEELTKAILDTVSDGSSQTLSVPSTLQASLMARLDRLPAAKQVAQIGAVIGREFPHILLAAVTGLPEAQLVQGLDQLVTAGLVFRRGLSPDAAYTFKHALVQEIAYESLLKTRRQQIHRQIAETVRDQLPDRAKAEPEIVAHHFTQAGLTALAVEWWGKAGDLALRRSAYSEAIAHLETALQLASELGDGPDQRLSRLQLQIIYGNALRNARGFGVPETQVAFTVASELAAGIEDVSARFPAYYGLWSGSFLRGDLKPMQEMSAAFLRDVEHLPESPEAAIAQRICGMTRWFEGNFIKAQRHLEQSLAIYDAVRDRELGFRFGQDLASPAMAYLALVLWSLGAHDRAVMLIEEAVTHALETKHIPTIAYAYAHAATFDAMRRDRGRAAPRVQACLSLAREYGLSVWLAFCTFHEGWLQSSAVVGEAGLSGMHHALRLMRLQEQGVFIPLLMTLLAETEAEAGRPDAALATLDMQLATVERTGQRWFLSELHRARGETLLKRRPADPAAAESAFMRAIAVARSQAAKLLELQAAASLARLWLGQKKRAEARELVAPFCAWFHEGIGDHALREVRAVLSDLALV